MLKYVRLTADDLPECAQLFVRVFRQPPWHEPWELAPATKRLSNTLNTPGFLGLKAIDEHCVLGFLMGYTEPYHTRTDLYLKEMCIGPESQKKGIGSGLMQALETIAREAGVDTVYLLTRTDIPAAHFYTKHGFAAHPHVVLMGRDYRTQSRDH